MTWVAAGRSRGELERFSARVVETAGVRERLHPEVVEVVEHARAVGWEAFIVSASPRSIVVEAARLVGVAPDHVVAAIESYDADGRVVCGVERPIPYGPGKVSRLRERLGPRTLYAAFGDNAFDVALLNAAEVRVAVRPKPRLVARAAEVPGIRVLDGRSAP
jgi:phosphoserine phosphatase